VPPLRRSQVKAGAVVVPRDGAIIFGDMIGKLGTVRVECAKCGRSGRSHDRISITSASEVPARTTSPGFLPIRVRATGDT
jgi:hypothetical protein